MQTSSLPTFCFIRLSYTSWSSLVERGEGLHRTKWYAVAQNNIDSYWRSITMFCFYKWADTSLHIRLLKALSIFSEFQCTITFLQSYIFIFSILMSRKYQCLPDFNEILFSRAPSYSTTIFSAIMSWYLNWTAVSPPQFRTRVCVEDRNKKMFPSFSINAWNAAVVITSQPQS